jgi:acetyl esterase/lipase
MRRTAVASIAVATLALGLGSLADAQRPRAPRGGPPPSRGPAPTHADVPYAPAEPANSKGHLLDLYLPAHATAPTPVVIWTGGSGWSADTGKERAEVFAAELTKRGFAVAGVSIRSSAQVKFPGQLHDIKSAIRWLRSNSARYNFDPNRIAIMGASSGGWTAAIAAVTGDVPELEGAVGVTGVSSAVQAAVAFYPPTDFLAMDRAALRPCTTNAPQGPGAGLCHDAESSPESRLIGCAIQSCPEKVELANPARYVSDADPPIMILHGESDPLVPHDQGELLYRALSEACRDAVFISLPPAGHGPAPQFLMNDALRAGATIRSTKAAGCVVERAKRYTPTWTTVVDFLRKSLGN